MKTLIVMLPMLTLFALGGCASGPNAPGRAEFSTPLPIPPLLEGTVGPDGHRRFDLQAQEGTRTFIPGVETPTLGLNGPHLAPTLRAHRGERVVVHLENRLREVTTLHWHGMELPAAMDGGPHQLVPPGGTWSPEWDIHQPAATLWYHPHPHGETERQVYLGMAGFFLVEDTDAAGRMLPSEYGVDDIPVMVQDVTLDGGGRLVRSKPWYNQVGPLGRTVLVNGAITPFLAVRRERVRLRLLNASPARVYRFGFDDGRPFHVIAGDGGLLAAPVEMERIQLSPGERAEVVVSLEPGATIILTSVQQALGTDPLNHRLSGGNDTFHLLELRAAARLAPSPPLPDVLAPVDPPRASPELPTRRFRVASTTINGQTMDMGRIDARMDAGSAEIWEVEGIAVPHNLHLHGVRFRVLDVGGEPVHPAWAGWKDTVYLMPDRITRLLIEAPEQPGHGVPFMFHCHFLRHEDDGAMGQFLVVGSGAGDAADPGVLREERR